jgi:hypothetical protein
MLSVLNRIFYPLFLGVVIIQGIHVVEHIIQLAQVYIFGVPDDLALGLLGYVFQFQGTEEWLHWLTTFLLALTRRSFPCALADGSAVGVCGLRGSGGVESWHVVEHR